MCIKRHKMRPKSRRLQLKMKNTQNDEDEDEIFLNYIKTVKVAEKQHENYFEKTENDNQ